MTTQAVDGRHTFHFAPTTPDKPCRWQLDRDDCREMGRDVQDGFEAVALGFFVMDRCSTRFDSPLGAISIGAAVPAAWFATKRHLRRQSDVKSSKARQLINFAVKSCGTFATGAVFAGALYDREPRTDAGLIAVALTTLSDLA